MAKPKRKPMSVTFIRTGERRYAVRATIDGTQTVQMEQAPGFDPLMPHDLQHFIVEKCLDIEGGIFGRLAAGGTAKTFDSLRKSWPVARTWTGVISVVSKGRNRTSAWRTHRSLQMPSGVTLT